MPKCLTDNPEASVTTVTNAGFPATVVSLNTNALWSTRTLMSLYPCFETLTDTEPQPLHIIPATDPHPDQSELNISLHALEGHHVPSTIRIASALAGKPVTVLIDGGSTHNFMQTKLATLLHLPIHPSPHLKVTVGNGQAINCEGVCSKATLLLDGHSFSVDLHLLQLHGADIVLGVQ